MLRCKWASCLICPVSDGRHRQGTAPQRRRAQPVRTRLLTQGVTSGP